MGKVRNRAAAAICLALWLPVAGCGGDEAVDPPALRMEFAFDVDEAIASRRLPPDVDRRAFLEESVAVVRKRIEALEVDGVRVNPLLNAGFEVLLDEGARGEVDAIRRVVTSLGTLAFRIQVLPTPNVHEQAKRTNAWPGTEEAFNDWKKREQARWLLLDASGTAYGPNREAGAAPYYLVKRRGRDGSSIDDFIVCEVPAERHTFDGRMVAHARVGTGPYDGQPVVFFDIRGDMQEAFGEWTALNVGLPMAMILNDEYVGGARAPIIQSRMTANVQITLGNLARAEAEAQAEDLATVLQAGALRVQPRLVAIQDLMDDEK